MHEIYSGLNTFLAESYREHYKTIGLYQMNGEIYIRISNLALFREHAKERLTRFMRFPFRTATLHIFSSIYFSIQKGAVKIGGKIYFSNPYDELVTDKHIDEFIFMRSNTCIDSRPFSSKF